MCIRDRFEAQITLLMLVAASAPAYGDDDGIGDVLRLGGGVINAVCDESVAGKPPSLELTRPALTEKTELDPWFQLQYPMTEAQAMSFLLGDKSLPGAWIVSPALQSRGEGARRRISLEICSGSVEPARLQKLISEQPSRFLLTEPRLPGTPSPSPPKGHALIRVRDVDHRFDKIGKQWRIPGWVEPYELVSIQVAGREYRRLANAITNRTQFIELVGKNDLPLGFIFPSSEPVPLDWSRARATAENEINRQRRAETYRLMIELDAYRVVSRHPSQGDEVRKLQDYYRNLISSYLQYPGEGQFTQYAKKAEGVPGEAEIKRALDAAFFSALSKAKVNGAGVGFTLFLPDPSLHGMYSEYRERLGRLNTPAAGN